MTLYIASDHAGVQMKQAIVNFLLDQGEKVVDLGPNTNESVDYPQYASEVCACIEGPDDRGILICGTGVGMCIAANRFSHIRAALCESARIAALSREHNNSNVLVLAGRFTTRRNAFLIVSEWLKTSFSQDSRHVRRLSML